MSKIDTEAAAAKKVKVELPLEQWVEEHTKLWARPVKFAELSDDRRALWAARRGNPIPHPKVLT